MSNLGRIEDIVANLPEAERVDIEEWGGHPSFRVRGKNFVFCNLAGTSVSLKLSTDEAQAVVATDPTAQPAGYGLGRHGWIDFTLESDAAEARWEVVEEWILTSYCLIAPKTLAQQVLGED